MASISVSEFKKIESMYSGCRFCGNAAVWPYGIAYKVNSCRECYRRDDFLERVAFLEANETDQPSARLETLQWERLNRAFYRKLREQSGIVEPKLTCPTCGESKPLFEFAMVGPITRTSLRKLECYDCISLSKDTIVCPCCKERKEREEFEDDKYTYRRCLSCRKESEERYLSCVSDQHCRISLSLRGIEETPAAMDLVRELILAKRIKQKAREKERRERNESGYANVQGE